MTRAGMGHRGGAGDVEPAVGLVVVEPGAEWPGPLPACAQVIALSEGTDELIDHAVERIERTNRPLGTVVLACNDEPTREAADRRLRVGRELRRAVARSASARLVVAGSSASGAGVRGQLFALMALLADELRETGVTVELRIPPPTAARGLVACRPPARALLRLAGGRA